MKSVTNLTATSGFQKLMMASRDTFALSAVYVCVCVGKGGG